MIIIGLCGKKGAGKNHVAELARAICAPSVVETAALADPIKEMAINLLGLSREDAYGSDKEKNRPSPYHWDAMPDFVRNKNPNKSGLMTVREVLQVLGTELFRDVWDPEIWSKALRRKVLQSKAEVFIIADVRFPDEVKAIREWGGAIWLVKGSRSVEDVKDGHGSENGLAHASFDHVIDNDWPMVTPEGLRKQVAEAMARPTIPG